MAEGTLSPVQETFLRKYLALGSRAGGGADGGSTGASPGPGNPVDIWLDARAEVGADIRMLQAELYAYDDPNLERIADQGLDGVTEGNNVRLMAALTTYNAAVRAGDDDARRKAAAAVVASADTFSAFLASDPIIALCEDNPFGKAVSIVAPLEAALKDIRTAVEA